MKMENTPLILKILKCVAEIHGLKFLFSVIRTIRLRGYLRKMN